MITVMVITLISLLFFALYLWLVLTFGIRTRKTTFHDPSRSPVSRRQKRTLWIVGKKNDTHSGRSPAPPAPRRPDRPADTSGTPAAQAPSAPPPMPLDLFPCAPGTPRRLPLIRRGITFAKQPKDPRHQ
ncbi:hypothetical protein [Actinocorallia populi]|uniref:hypothetical protein n=1 Tax=Actinocorallia populi TaxID=2079200 RepID=UPI0013007B99|nr:hypothetical protein [Actinocorallia populi]